MKPSPEAELRIERAELLTQKFKRGLDAKEHARLEEIRQCLDDIEMARYGPDLDRLERVGSLGLSFTRRSSRYLLLQDPPGIRTIPHP